jgi:hypothetical protein
MHRNNPSKSPRSQIEMKDDDEYPRKPGAFWVRHEHFSGSRTFVARVFMVFLVQDRRKPKTFQAPHYQRDPPGVHGEDEQEEDWDMALT